MKLTQELMDVYTMGATDNGTKNWDERNDSKGVQAVLLHLAGQNPGMEVADRGTRTSRELTQVRTVHTNVKNSRARIIGAAGMERSDPEAYLIVRVLDTVEEILRPWQRVGQR